MVKIHPVIVKSQSLQHGDRVKIINQDDDMYNKTGIFEGNYNHPYGNRSLIILDEIKKAIYVNPNDIVIYSI